MNKFWCIIVLGIIPVWMMAQSDSTSTQGEVVSGEIIIQKDRKITLPKATKLYQRGDLLGLDTAPLDINMSAKEPALEWPSYVSDIPLVPVPQTTTVASYQNYASLGYGNYGSPLARVGIFERLGSFDLRNTFMYERYSSGPVNGSSSGNSIGAINLSGTRKSDKMMIAPFLNYSHRSFRFYGNTDRQNPGFNTLEELDRVNLSSFHLGTHIQGASGSHSYEVTPKIGRTAQKQRGQPTLNSENAASVDGAFVLKMNKGLDAGLKFQTSASRYTGGVEYNRSLLQATPWVGYSGDRYTIKGGLQLASSNADTLSNVGVYPDLIGTYQLDDNWSLVGHLRGGMTWQSLDALLNELEFLDDSLQILNQETNISFGGGLHGLLLKDLLFEVDLSFSSLKDLPFFVPSDTDSSRYTIVYDRGNVNQVTLSSTLKYSPSKNAMYSATIVFNSFDLDNLDRPWHLPRYQFSVNSSHTLQEKVIFSTQLTALGGLRAPTTVGFGIEDLDPIIDLGFTVDYRITKRFSAFVLTTNLLNRAYERYLG